MKLLTRRLFILLLCAALPCGAIAQSAAPEETVTHATFTLSAQVHADGFPPVEAHLKDWETFLNKLTLTGDLYGIRFLQPESRVYMEGALNIDGVEIIPFAYDQYGASRYFISPILRDNPVLFQMNSYYEFMLKPFYYLGMPSNYIAILTYPSGTYYIVDSYYTPIRDMIAAAREAALSDAAETPIELQYTIPYSTLLALCGTLNAVALEDTITKRVQMYLDALLAELYNSDVIFEIMSHFELFLANADPEMKGLLVTETASGMVCTLGGQDVFSKRVTGNQTEILFDLPLPDAYRISLTYRSETLGSATNVSAGVTVSEGGETAISVSMEGTGLPVDGALHGEGTVVFSIGGREIYEVPAPLTMAFRWSRTAAELPYDLDLSIDWLHPQTGLPAISVEFDGALEAGDYSAFSDKTYNLQNFFWLNPTLLEEHKKHWGPSILAYMLPVALEMPIGVIDDVVDFLLDSDILISIAE